MTQKEGRHSARIAERFGSYPTGEGLLQAFRKAAQLAGGRESVAGSSVLGRPMVRFDLGSPGRPCVLLSALMHGVEVIGSLALLALLQRLGDPDDDDARHLRNNLHIVVLPITNPDACVANLARIGCGRRAWQRCNANGVDLNRNFPRMTSRRLLHPFSGSRFRASPHYLGPHPFSEPESRAVRSVALETRPELSLAFHSFGNLLLFPWAYTDQPNPRERSYIDLAAAMCGAMTTPYEVRQARHLYSVLGDMDDWLDAELGALAFTVEVSRPAFEAAELAHLINPFAWMNPRRVNAAVENVVPGVMGLMTNWLDGRGAQTSPSRSPIARPSVGRSLAAK